MKKGSSIFASILLLLAFNHAIAYGNTVYQNRDTLAHLWKTREIKINGKIGITDIATPATEIPQFLSLAGLPHPCNDSIPEDISTQVTLRNKSLSKDSLCSADLIWVLRPYLQWLQNIDPHLRAEPQPIHFSNVKKLTISPYSTFYRSTSMIRLLWNVQSILSSDKAIESCVSIMFLSHNICNIAMTTGIYTRSLF